jgi:hypothetical protein
LLKKKGHVQKCIDKNLRPNNNISFINAETDIMTSVDDKQNLYKKLLFEFIKDNGDKVSKMIALEKSAFSEEAVFKK